MRKYLIALIISSFIILLILSYLNQPQQYFIQAIIYLSPYCDCCKRYSEYLNSYNIKIQYKYVEDVNLIMDSYNIPENLRSCHILIMENYLVVGHVPIEAINKLLNEKPKIKGISLPGMPSGSPGMGGVKNDKFIIYSFNDKVNIFMII